MAFRFPDHVFDQGQPGGFDIFVGKFKQQSDIGDFDPCPEMLFRNDNFEKILPDKGLYFLADLKQSVAGMIICPALGQFFSHFFHCVFVFLVHNGSKLSILFYIGGGHVLLSGFFYNEAASVLLERLGNEVL